MGGVFKREYIWWNIRKGLDASQKRQRIAQDAGGYIKHPDPKHWMDERTEGYGSSRKQGFQVAPLLTA